MKMVDFLDLPDDPEMAFVALVKMFDGEREASIASSEERSDTSIFLLDYMNNVFGAAEGLHLDIYDGWEMPTTENNVWPVYREFSLITKRSILEIQIRHARIGKHYSVGLDTKAKAKIRHFVEQIKTHLDQLDLDERKRNSLTGKLNKFLDEVDRERTRYDSAMDIAISLVGVVDKGASPIIELVDSITRLLAQAKSTEPLELPPPRERKKLEAPRRQLPKPSRDDMNDDIPF